MQCCGSMCFCDQRNYMIERYIMWVGCREIDIVGSCGVCTGCRAAWDWVMEFVEGFVICLLFHIRDWCHWPVIHWLVYCVDRRGACRTFPSNSYRCLCGMVLIALRFLLRFHSRVCYLIYAMHKQVLDFWFIYIVRVPCAFQSWMLRIVWCMLCCRYCTLVCIFHWGYFGPVFRVVVGMLCL